MCNESCFFCSAEVANRKHINRSLKSILLDILNAFKNWSSHIEFIWGEVLLRKDIFIIIAYCKRLWFKKISIETNGTILSDNAICIKLLKAGLNNITLSIHGSSSPTNDVHTGLPGSFIKKMEAIKNLELLSEKYDFSLQTNFVITSKNIHEIPGFLEMVSKMSVIKNYIFAFVRPLISYRDNYKNYLPDLGEIKKIFETVEFNNKIRIQYLPYCVLDESFHESYQDSFAKWLKKDTDKSYGDNADINLEKSIQDNITYFKECYSCKFYHKCRWFWTEYVDYFHLTVPPNINSF